MVLNVKFEAVAASGSDKARLQWVRVGAQITVSLKVGFNQVVRIFVQEKEGASHSSIFESWQL